MKKSIIVSMLLLVLLIASAAIAYGMLITGRVVEISPTGMVVSEPAESVNCTDTDGGKNYNVKGDCYSPGGYAPDICLADSQNPSITYLNEKYCDASGCANEKYLCPSNTVCAGGRCCVAEGGSIAVIPNPPSCCDGLALIPPKDSSLVGSSGFCTAKCGNGVCDSATESTYNCPADCKAAITCTDTDGGKDYYAAGSSTGSNGVVWNDRCREDNGNLVETYCNGEYVNFAEYTCPYGCSNGACLQSPTTCGNRIKDGTEQCDGSDLGGMACSHFPGYGSGTLKCKSDCTFDLSSCNQQNCGNRIKEYPEECDGSDFGSLTCQSFGYTGGTLSCSIMCVTMKGGCTNASARTCTDTDGGKNYFVKGTTSSYLNTLLTDRGSDGCYDDNYASNGVYDVSGNVIKPATGTKVSETYCDSSNMYRSEVVNCPSPGRCWDGACVRQKVNVTDFKLESGYYQFYIYYIFNDIYVDRVKVSFDKTYAGGAAGTIYKVPCKEGKLLEAAYVNPVSKEVTYASYDISVYRCTQLNTTTCTDTDNSPDYDMYPSLVKYPLSSTNNPDFFVKGTGKGVYAGSSAGTYSTYYDHCGSETQLNEYFCMANGKLGSIGVTCPNICKDGICVKADEYPYLDLLTRTTGKLVHINADATPTCGNWDTSWCKATNPGASGTGPYEFKWGDGYVTCSSFPAEHTYSSANTYTVKVRVKNTCGLISERSKAVTATNCAPNAAALVDFRLFSGSDSSTSVSSFLELGETKTFSLGGTEFEVKLVFADLEGTAKLQVNGVLTKQMKAGDTSSLGSASGMAVYITVNAVMNSPGNGAVDFTLENTQTGSKISDKLVDYQAKAYTLDGKGFEVKALFINGPTNPSAKLALNGVATSEIRQGSSQTIEGKYKLTVTNVWVCTQPAQNACTDSDGGKNFYEKGSITGSMPSGFIATDMCVTDSSGGTNRLREVICENNYGTSYLYDCPYGCKDGACISSDVCDLEITLRDGETGTYSIGGFDFEITNVFTDAYQMKAKFTVNGVATKGLAQEQEYVVGGLMLEVKKISVLNNEASVTLCLKKTSSSPTLFFTCSWGGIQDRLYQGQAKAYAMRGNTYEVKAVSTPYGTKTAKFSINGIATNILGIGSTDTYNKEISIRPLEVLTSSSDGMVEFCLEDVSQSFRCIDSDGGKNIHLKGHIISGGKTYWDKCYDLNTGAEVDSGMMLLEMYCPTSETGAQAQIKCPYGCKGGACLLAPENSTMQCNTTGDCPMPSLPPPDYRECNGNYKCAVGGGYRCVSGKCIFSKSYSNCELCTDGCSGGICIGQNENVCESNAGCGEMMYCELPVNSCSGIGKCVVKPIICLASYNPVCGCDGETYSNDCARQAAGLSRSRNSMCGLEDEEPEKPAIVKDSPVCDKIGTRAEGWYLNGELVRYARCSCIAECKYQGTDKEGFYNSCTGEAILYTLCSGQLQVESKIQLIIKDKPVEIEQNIDKGVVEIISATEKASTTEKLRLEEGKLSLVTLQGLKEINYLPDDAKQALQQEYGDRLREIQWIELREINGKPVYVVKSKVREYLLWIIPISFTKSLKVDAGTNELV